MKNRIALSALLLLCSQAHAIDILGPVYPPPGGVTFSSTGSSAGDAGGVTWSYSLFNAGAFTNLIWGPDTSLAAATRVGAGLDNTLHALSLLSTSSSQAIWQGVTGWTGGGGSRTVQLRATVVSGGLSWIAATSLPPDPDIAGVGAVIDNSLGVDFSVRLEFLADVGGGSFQAINTIMPQTAGHTRSSFGAAFYYVAVSEPATLLLFGLGILGLYAARRRTAPLVVS